MLLCLIDPAFAAAAREGRSESDCCLEGPGVKCTERPDFNRDLYADDYEQCLFLCAAEGEEGCTFFTYFGSIKSCWLYYSCDGVGDCDVRACAVSKYMYLRA